MNRAAWRRFWAQRLPHDDVIRRAAGRSRYNHRRRLDADLRMLQVAERLLELGFERGAQSQIAREFGVDRATITRDLAALREAGFEEWNRWELADRLNRAERKLARFHSLDANRWERETRYALQYGTSGQTSARPGRGEAYTQFNDPPQDLQERRQRDADNYVAQNIETILKSLLGPTGATEEAW